MRRIPYRIILPVVQLALYLVLVWLGCYYRQTWQAQFEHWITSRPVAATEFIPGWVDGPVSFEEQLAFGINAPAVLASGLVLRPLDSAFHDGASEELAAHTAAILLIPVLWYFIGRRLEHRTGEAAHRSKVGKISRVAGLAVASAVALLALSHASLGEMPVAQILTLAWIIVGIVAASRTIRRWRMRVATN